MKTPLLVQVSTNSTGNITLYLEALNYNIAQFPNGTVKNTLGLALNAAALAAGITTLGANTPIIADTLDLATGALLAAGILPLKVTAAAVAVCQTDSIPAGTYTGVGVALAGAVINPDASMHSRAWGRSAGALLPSTQLCMDADDIAAQRSGA